MQEKRCGECGAAATVKITGMGTGPTAMVALNPPAYLCAACDAASEAPDPAPVVLAVAGTPAEDLPDDGADFAVTAAAEAGELVA